MIIYCMPKVPCKLELHRCGPREKGYAGRNEDDSHLGSMLKLLHRIALGKKSSLFNQDFVASSSKVFPS